MGQRAGFHAVVMVSGEAWNFPVETSVAEMGSVSWQPGWGFTSTLGPLGKWVTSQDGTGSPAVWGSWPLVSDSFLFRDLGVLCPKNKEQSQRHPKSIFLKTMPRPQ